MGRGLLLRRVLTSRGPLSRRDPQTSSTNAVLATLSGCCPPPKGRLPTCYSPVRRFTRGPKPTFSLDLHVLSLPLTFALSQDQTLHLDRHPVRKRTGLDEFIRFTVSTALRREQPRRGLAIWLKTHDSLSLFSFQRPTRSSVRAGDTNDPHQSCQGPEPCLPGYLRGVSTREPVSTTSNQKEKSFLSFLSFPTGRDTDQASCIGGPGKI
jgi:hypothetical protein